jgi:putative lipoprotein
LGGLAGLLITAACSRGEGGASTVAAVSLAGSSWTVTAIDGQTPVTGRDAPSLAFDGAGRVSGATGCNRFSGGFTTGEGGALTIGGDGAALASTRMACAPELNEQESRMLAALGAVAGFSIQADRLSFTDAAGEIVMEAVPASSAAPR